ncbi:MAG: peptidyl-prolyl cis-trans isomerase [Desulfobacterales bacterium]|nr:peptidyl-prolyl cis-trans isomerase [Desulfobacterales bacterium]
MNLSEADIRLQFEQNLAIQQFIDKQFAQKITISAKESETYYNEHPEYFKQPEQVQASHILIKVESGANEAKKTETRNKIREIQQQLQKGKDFDALAKEFSECPSSAKGGDLGYFRRGAMVKPFEDAAFALKPGEVSDIVETPFGYHLIKVVDKKAENTINYDTIKDKINQHLKREKVQTEVSSYLAKLKEEATIKNFLK